jgi:hypothetical protein
VNRRILKLKRPSLLCLLLVIGVAAPLSSVQAVVVDIDVENEGFESLPYLIDQEVTPFTTPGLLTDWTYYTPDLNYFFGSYIPSSPGEYDLPISLVTDHVMYIDVVGSNRGVDGGGNLQQIGFEQVLTSTLEAGTYNLSVAVGNPRSTVDDDYTGFGGYGIELFAGGTVLGSAVGDGDSIGEGLFQTIDLTVDVLGDNALLGAALGIRLYNRNLTLNDASFDTYSGIAFDNVQLSLSPVPVPAAIWLFGSALLGLTGFNLRRKRAALNGSC